MIANALPTAVADADTLPFGGIDHAESRNSYQGDQVIVVSHESKLDIKKEICDDENLQRTVNTFDVSAKLSADVADSSNDVVKVTTNQEPQRESKRRISENFDFRRLSARERLFAAEMELQDTRALLKVSKLKQKLLESCYAIKDKI